MCSEKTSSNPQKDDCGCGGASKTEDMNKTSIPYARLEEAKNVAQSLLTKKLGDCSPMLTDTNAHYFDKGFCVGSCAGTENMVYASMSGVVDKIPYDVITTYDTTFYQKESENADEKDIMWVEIEIVTPVKNTIRLPFRGIGVLRDPTSGHILKIADFELATNLMPAMAGDVLKAIACILACVGLVCALLCAGPCVTVAACLICLMSCVGANIGNFMTCIAACGIVTGLTP